MPRLVAALVVALVLVGGGFLAGRASVQVDDAELRHRAENYRAARDNLAKFWTDLHKRYEERGRRIDSLEVVSSALRQSAARREARADERGRRADSLEFAGDTLAACAERREECRELRGALADMKEGARADDSTKRELRRQLADLREGRARDSSLALTADTLVADFEKRAGGCRIPLLGASCPVAVVDWNLTDKLLTLGPGIPFKVGRFNVTGSVSWRVAGRGSGGSP